MATEDPLMKQRIGKIKEIRNLGINPYPYRFVKTDSAKKILDEYNDKLQPGEETNNEVAIAGRIMTNRDMGKVGFFNVQDITGTVQVYAKKDDLGEKFTLYKKLDLGDIVGINGRIFKTHKGETSVYAKEITLLAKSIRSLPEKWHGIKDTEIKYRQRYLDLISNKESMDIFVKRTQIIKTLRNFLDNKGFMEVETPILQTMYGGARAKPFITTHNELKMQMYLRISPELYLKRLLVGGFEKIYDINKNFRNESIDTSHNPEFTMIEFYQAYADYYDMMDLVEEIYCHVAKMVLGTTMITWQGNTFDLAKKWERLTMEQAVKKYSELDIERMNDEKLKELVQENKLDIGGTVTRGKLVEAIFGAFAEKKIIEPTFIIDHPVEISPLTKEKRTDPRFVERFEPIICGMEIGNAYSELNDPIEQRKRLKEQQKEMRLDKEAHPLDEEFLTAMEHGMPPTGGVGLGIDRMVMIMTNSSSIKDVILFPTMKKEEEQKPQEKKETTENKETDENKNEKE